MNLTDRWLDKTYRPREIIIQHVYIENDQISYRTDIMVRFMVAQEKGYARVTVDSYALSHMNVDIIREAIYKIKYEIEKYTFNKYKRRDYINENQITEMIASELYRFNTIGNIRMRS